MPHTNYDNSSIIKHVEYEHDYSLSERCIPKLEDCKDNNVFRKKLSRSFGLADKWTDRLLMPVVTGGDWNKIIDRETAILKIQYPFLPEQQLRGKAYKKFGIPAVMGGVVSRATAIFQGKVIPQELLKSRKKDRKMSLSQEVGKLESISELSSIDKQYLQRVLKVKVKRRRSTENKDPLMIETPRETGKNSIISNESETPTPDFEFHNENAQLSNYSQLTELSKLNTQLRKSDDNIEIYSLPTQFVTPNLELFGNQAVNNVESGEIAYNIEISQVVSLAEIPTQLSTEKDFFYTDLNDNFILSKNVPSRKRKSSQSPFSSPKRSTSSGKSSTGTQISLPFDTVDIDDSSQLPTPGIYNLRLNNVDHDYSFNGCRKMANFLPEFNSQEILTNKIVNNEAESLITKNNLKRKRQNIRTTENKEDEENFRATTNNREKKFEYINMGFNSNSKSVLKPSCLNTTLNLMSPTRQLNSNFSCDKSKDSFSPDSSRPPKRKKRRLEFCDRVSTTFTPKDCELKSLYSRDKMKEVRTLDPSDEVEDQEISIVTEIKKNPPADSSAILGENLEKKSLLKSNISSSAFMTKDCGLTPFYSRDEKKKGQIVEPNEKNDDTDDQDEQNDAFSSQEKMIDDEIERYPLREMPISRGTKPVYARHRKNEVQTAENLKKNDSSSSHEILLYAQIDQNEISVEKSTIREKVGAIDFDYVCDGKETAESSEVVLTDDHEENSLLTSSTTHLTGSTTFVPESLSNSRCNSNFSIDSPLFSKLDENVIGKTNLTNNSSVVLAVIHKEIEDILKFLDTDIKNDELNDNQE